jgi:uncharacterized protein YyaL (SSP411 family)
LNAAARHVRICARAAALLLGATAGCGASIPESSKDPNPGAGAPPPAAAAPAAAPVAPAAAAQEPPPVTAKTNRLAHETSPYLLQHAHNPVDWYPWGAEAFAKAKQEDKPIFLSVGYSACHWCHVMERECFEDAAIAALMNELFVCIKVDREERPDVDEIYMKSVQILTRSGGWPMSVWLTPDGEPFYGGTYFPPQDGQGRPGFPRVLKEMGRIWKEERPRALAAAADLTQKIREISLPDAAPAGGELPADLVELAAAQIVAGFDDEHGGFGGAPKFPHPMDLSLLLRVVARDGDEKARHAALFTLQKMAAGGMYDQVGGGFHRYSTDERWLVPHFEKMLYDNALLASTYLDAWLVTQDEEYARTVREILDYVLREMTSPAGGFYSTQDADSEGEEGKFFVWTTAELAEVLGADLAAWVGPWFGASPSGNFEHRANVLSRPWTVEDFAKAKSMQPEELRAGLEVARRKLYDAREKRVKPARDDKILADWNGLMIGAFARAGFHLGEARYVEAARKAAAFARASFWRDGRLLRSTKDGTAKHAGNLVDYAFLADGVLDLYEAGFDPADLAFARDLVRAAVANFWDEKEGGFFTTAHDAELLIARSKEAYDGATPSGPSVMVMDLLRVAELLGDDELRAKAERTLALYRPLLTGQPRAVTRMMAAVDFLQSAPREIVIATPTVDAAAVLLDVLRKGFDRDRVLLVRTDANGAGLEKIAATVEAKGPVGGKAAAYVCRHGACQLPITDPAKLAELLSKRE